MSALEITSMSTKGQVVIPQIIRSECHIESGTKFIVMTDGENILLKPIEKPKMASFKSLLKRSQKFSKDKGLKKDEVPKAIKKVRRENRT